jgi:hypothetical protein
MTDTQIEEDINFHDEFAKANGHSTRRGKDVAPHHITPEEHTLGDILARASHVQEPIADLLARADASLLGADCSDFLRNVGVHVDDMASRLRHRATMLRQRADELDTLGDNLEGPCAQLVRSTIETYSEQCNEIEVLLRSYAHVNPTAVR